MKENYGFKRGINQVRAKDLSDVRRRIMEALKLSNPSSWYLRVKGRIEARFKGHLNAI